MSCEYKKIKYDQRVESINGRIETYTLTQCPNGCDMNVGSASCIMDCDYFVKDDKDAQEVYCSYDEGGGVRMKKSIVSIHSLTITVTGDDLIHLYQACASLIENNNCGDYGICGDIVRTLEANGYFYSKEVTEIVKEAKNARDENNRPIKCKTRG